MNAHVFLKGEQAHTRIFGPWPSGQGWTMSTGHAIDWPKYKEKEEKNLLINLLTVIQLVHIACICFLKDKQPTQDFLRTMAFQSGGDTKSDFSLTEG